MFDTAVTLKHTRSLKVILMGKAQLNEYYHHAKFDIYHVYTVQEDHNIKVLPHMDNLLADITPFFVQVRT